MSNDNGQINEKFLSFSPPIVPWHQITALSIAEPFHLNHLHLLLSQATNLRILELHYKAVYDCKIHWEEETLIDLLNDSFLCNMLMSNGLRQLNLFIVWQQSNLLDIIRKQIDIKKNNQREEAALSNNHHILTLILIGWRLISEKGIRLIMNDLVYDKVMEKNQVKRKL
jgi:hypothetical protein